MQHTVKLVAYHGNAHSFQSSRTKDKGMSAALRSEFEILFYDESHKGGQPDLILLLLKPESSTYEMLCQTQKWHHPRFSWWEPLIRSSTSTTHSACKKHHLAISGHISSQLAEQPCRESQVVLFRCCNISHEGGFASQTNKSTGSFVTSL